MDRRRRSRTGLPIDRPLSLHLLSHRVRWPPAGAANRRSLVRALCRRPAEGRRPDRSADPPRPQRRPFAFPPGITVERATSPQGGAKGRHLGRHPCPPPCRASGQKGGGAPSTSSPSRAAPRRTGRGGDTPGAAPPRLSQPTRGIRANPCPIRLSRQGPGYTSEGAPSEREALWLSKACAT